MHVGIVAPPWIPIPPSRYGGVERIVDTLARGLQRLGCDISLFATGDSECQVPVQSVIQVADRSLIGDSETERVHARAAYTALQQCDIINDHFAPSQGQSLVGPNSLSPRVVITAHGPLEGNHARYYLDSARRGARVVSVSSLQTARNASIPIDRQILHGIETDQYSLGTGSGGYALFLGRFAAEKRVTAAMQVAHEAGMPLVLAGKLSEPAESKYFNVHVRPRLGNGVSYVGEVGGRERRKLLGEASVLLFTSAPHEPYGLVILESLACGTPVVATRSGCAGDVIQVGVNGYICDSLASMVAASMEATDLRREVCKSSIEPQFTAGRMVAEYLEYFESVLR